MPFELCELSRGKLRVMLDDDQDVWIIGSRKSNGGCC
jgi:hypothetical protein